jgi:hypothetical protein
LLERHAGALSPPTANFFRVALFGSPIEEMSGFISGARAALLISALLLVSAMRLRATKLVA